MKYSKGFPENKIEQLLLFPTCISFLAANYHNGIDKKEKEIAIELAHIETFSNNPVLIYLFEEANKNYEEARTILRDHLLKRKKDGEREIVIQEELGKLEKNLTQLEIAYSSTKCDGIFHFHKSD